MWRKKAEVDKLRAELLGLRLESILRAQELRRAYTDAQAALTPLLSTLFRCLEQNAERSVLDDAREAACHHLTSQVIPRFVDYAEIHAQVEYSEPLERQAFIDDDVLPELKLFLKWLRVLNLPALLARLSQPKRSVLRIEKRALNPIRRIAKGVETPNHHEYYARFDEVLNGIVAACSEPEADAA